MPNTRALMNRVLCTWQTLNCRCSKTDWHCKARLQINGKKPLLEEIAGYVGNIIALVMVSSEMAWSNFDSSSKRYFEPKSTKLPIKRPNMCLCSVL
jgi:hypothetical protein